MKKLLWVLLIGIWLVLFSCVNGNQRIINNAERIMEFNSDSALRMLEKVEYPELLTDSLKAKYYYLKGYCHLNLNTSLVSDSIIGFSIDFYRHRSPERAYRSEIVESYRKFWIGDVEGAIRGLDSLSYLPGIDDTVRYIPLRLLVLLESSLYNGQRAVDALKEVIRIDKDEYHQTECAYLLAQNYIFAGKPDSALIWVDYLVNIPDTHDIANNNYFKFVLRGIALGEAGKLKEAVETLDDILIKYPGNPTEYAIRIYKALNFINMNHLDLAKKELAIADSLQVHPNLGQPNDPASYVFKNLLESIIDYRERGNISARSISAVSNREQERFNRMLCAQFESERSAMEYERRAMDLKIKNDQKTLALLIGLIVVLLVLVVGLWYYTNHKRRLAETEEKAEALNKLVKELQSNNSNEANEIYSENNDNNYYRSNICTEQNRDKDRLRRAMLQQLGIIKMVAETPTEQNCEMLRKFSSAEGNNLVNWQDVYTLIDTLHDNFYTKLKNHSGQTLSDKEIQIAVLIVAGFSTKEIAVITQQSSGTIYVRKTSIRHKLGIPDREDILAYLLQI